MISCQRELFNIPSDVTYLNSAYMGAQLKSVSEAGIIALKRKERPWTIGIPEFFDEVDVARDLFGQLVGAGADDVAIVPAVSYGATVAASNIKLKDRRKIVVLKDQFPSNYYSWRTEARDQEGDLVTVDRRPDQSWTQAIYDTIDDQTAVVSVPNVHWTDGRMIDLLQIRSRCDQMGAMLCVDLSQSLGVIPFSVKDVRPDYMFCAGYKWLLCPYSSSFLYVDPMHQDGTPIEDSWAIREGARNFAGLVNYRDTYQKGARRFDAGQRSNFTSIPMVCEALTQILRWEPQRIASTLSVLIQAIAKGAPAIGGTTPPASECAPHIVGVKLPEGEVENAAERLRHQNIIVSIRGTSLRISPHLFNTEADVHKLLNALD
jgi:selenocysteine lyase/cysteine desulfurase